MQLNPANTGLQNLIELFNTQNSQVLTTADFDVAAAVVRTPAVEDPNQRNTSVTISAKAGSLTHKGSQTFTYNRLDLDQIATVKALGEFQSTAETTVADIKAWAVAQLGLIDADVEIVETEMPVWTDEMIDGETAPFTLRAVAGSYAYIGETTITVVEPVDGRDRMSDLYASTELNGFDYPVA